ncbi:MAG: hypothetical protein P1V97_18470 [Planctomycetota bacterium]|nr:hypothetical protein [Planctomycetota bacterium]
MDLETYIEKKNSDAFADFMIKGIFGSFFSFFVYSFIYFAAHSLSSNYAPWFASAYLIIGVGTAWRRVDPLRGLPALNNDENAQREIDGLANTSYPSAQDLSQPQRIVATILFLLRGPRAVLEALQAWKLRIPADSAIIKEAQEILNQSTGNTIIKGQHQAVWLLGYLNLATVQRAVNTDEYEIVPTPRGQTLSSQK